MTLQNPFLPPIPPRSNLPDQTASGGQAVSQEALAQAASPATASTHSLFYLGPSGPSIPVFGRLRHDFSHMMSSFMRGPFREAAAELKESTREPMMSRVGYAISKVMGGHMGDRSFDAFDWVPLVALLVATGLILSGLFPTGLTNFGINQGQLVVGRRDSRLEDETVLDKALSKFSLLIEDSFHAVLALSCGPAICQCCVTAVTVVVFRQKK